MLLRPFPSADGRSDLARGEEVRDLDLRVLERVRAMGRVLADAASKELANGAGLGLRRVGCAHDLAVLRDRVFTLEHGDEHRAARHELDELAEERARLVNGVEALSDLTR